MVSCSRLITLIEKIMVKSAGGELSLTFHIVEKTTDKIPHSLPCSDTDQITDSTINEIIKRYENHPSILNIKVNT